LVVFTLSAGLAGLGGAIYGGSQGLVGPDDFALLSSLTLLLLAVVWGIRTTGGMLFAGVTLAIGPVVQTHIHSIPDLLSLFVGLAAIGVSQNPEGTFGNRTPAQAWRNRQARERAAAAAAAAGVGGAAATEELSHVAG
jgi:ABC-type branched-subunit amino acid transport system permease subunit